MGYASTPPNPPIADEERKAYGPSVVKFGRFILIYPFALKVSVCGQSLIASLILP
ncbi:hypothetical protein NEOLEDRAFT_1138526 [Neolentinus lepideus HHB14362 ss-1]|uniref:Uncharacterized protein n=1 Tax=Neolentinus lepideus HHB14362 ss-1 TaxID=1314782 RepID=A0A165Q6Z6_9AGAM|nr:hypothetical protein NEOLEDRAFT_1138526 [Neolentinus lepideus HHB14362 ss-1]